jgi:hypothetical protein
MINEQQNDRDVLRECMESLGVTDYELKGAIVFWQGEDIGSLAYLNSRRVDQLQAILARVRNQKQEG